MSSSREDSPDWLRSFQAPTLSLSSDSNSSPSKNKPQGDVGDAQVTHELTSHSHAAKHSVHTLSLDNSPLRGTGKGQFKESTQGEDAVLLSSRECSPSKKAPIKKSSKKQLKVDAHTQRKENCLNYSVPTKGNHVDLEGLEEGKCEKLIDPLVSNTRLPLLLSEKVQRSKALVECEGESIDLSGDVGAVGRIVVPNTPSGNSEMYLDLKGTIYRTTIVPSRTFCIVSFGQSEAKMEAIMNDFIQLKAQSNVYEAETMVEGTLEGFSFDSEDEAEKMAKIASYQTSQNEGIEEEQTKRKTKGKAEKSSGSRKKGKTAGGKLQLEKKVRKKTQVSKKAKTKK